MVAVVVVQVGVALVGEQEDEKKENKNLKVEEPEDQELKDKKQKDEKQEDINQKEDKGEDKFQKDEEASGRGVDGIGSEG